MLCKYKKKSVWIITNNCGQIIVLLGKYLQKIRPTIERKDKQELFYHIIYILRKNTESINARIFKTTNRTIMFLTKCLVCNSENLTFTKE